jgi:hypothetical protein
MSRQASKRRGGSSAPLAIIGASIFVAVVLAVLYVLYWRGGGGGSPPDNRQTVVPQATVAALSTVVASQQAQAIAQNTEIARLQQRIVQLQQPAAILTQTPLNQANGPHSYLASFQVGMYTYVIFLQWTETSGFIHNGRLLTTDNYALKASESLRFDGVNNNGSYGFTTSSQGETTTFTGKANSDGTFTVIGLPWNVFRGFIGGTFSQTLHVATLTDYNAAVANLGSPPR